MMGEVFSGEGSEDKLFEDAIVVQSIAKEYEYLNNIFKDGWELQFQALCFKDEKYYDKLCIKLSNGNIKTLIFDINSFHGKRKIILKTFEGE